MKNDTIMIGAATAAHQVEGNNIYNDCWALEHIEHSTYQEPSGMAVDHYNRYEEDIRLMAEAGLNAYRFSIEWARIQPEKDQWIESEVEHYRKVIACCHSYNITPVVTLFHFSSPKWVTAQRGWENPEIITLFKNYCVHIVKELGADMEYVCTINEANMRLQISSIEKAYMARMTQKQAESNVQVGIQLMIKNRKLTAEETAITFGVKDPREVVPFVSSCSAEGDELVMKAHEAARDAIKAICPHLKVGLTLSLHDMQWKSGGEEYAKQEWNDEFIHYLSYIKKDDFLGVQSYSRKVFDQNGVSSADDGCAVTQMGYDDYPEAIAHVVRKVAEEFHGELIVTENGIATDNDDRRCEFIEEAVKGIAECREDGIPVSGYLYWSLLDNFEWQKGFTKTFGLIAVNRETQQRIPKKSLQFLADMRKVF